VPNEVWIRIEKPGDHGGTWSAGGEGQARWYSGDTIVHYVKAPRADGGSQEGASPVRATQADRAGGAPPCDRDVADGAALSEEDFRRIEIRLSDEPSYDDAVRLLAEVRRLRARERELTDDVDALVTQGDAYCKTIAEHQKRAEAAEARVRDLENAIRAALPDASFFAKQTLRAALKTDS
jgi:hypothetical protein